jgi:hypothetical protein
MSGLPVVKGVNIIVRGELGRMWVAVLLGECLGGRSGHRQLCEAVPAGMHFWRGWVAGSCMMKNGSDLIGVLEQWAAASPIFPSLLVTAAPEGCYLLLACMP